MVIPNDNFDYPQKIKKIISMYLTPHKFSEMIKSSDKNLKLRFVAKSDEISRLSVWKLSVNYC